MDSHPVNCLKSKHELLPTFIEELTKSWIMVQSARHKQPSVITALALRLTSKKPSYALLRAIFHQIIFVSASALLLDACCVFLAYDSSSPRCICCWLVFSYEDFGWKTKRQNRYVLLLYITEFMFPLDTPLLVLRGVRYAWRSQYNNTKAIAMHSRFCVEFFYLFYFFISAQHSFLTIKLKIV